jgi:hypothetical protein
VSQESVVQQLRKSERQLLSAHAELAGCNAEVEIYRTEVCAAAAFTYFMYI